jgi:hypothetical protein
MNQVLLRHSLCDNPELMERITLYATGLGDTKKDCTVVSPTANAGNGNVICDADVQAGMEELHRKEPAYSYAVRGVTPEAAWTRAPFMPPDSLQLAANSSCLM